jgi:hypothetical protein
MGPAMTEPRTAAGREVLRRQDAAGLDESQLGITVEDIRRIEREMYDLASNDGYHAGINDCREHDPAHQAASPDSETLRAALDELLNALNVYERNWAADLDWLSTGYGKVSAAKARARAALAATEGKDDPE